MDNGRTNERPIADARYLRATFGRFASGVTIVTCGAGDDVHGMTANSFVSVSLDPALGLISLSRASRMHTRLIECERFGISVLADEQHDVSRHFAGQMLDDYRPEFVEHDRVAVVRGALAWMVCERQFTYPAGTHTLFVGRLVDCGYRDDGAPLIFFGGGYETLASSRLQ